MIEACPRQLISNGPAEVWMTSALPNDKAEHKKVIMMTLPIAFANFSSSVLRFHFISSRMRLQGA
jgi:hypothetical protein